MIKKILKTFFVSLLMSASAYAEYQVTARHLTWDEAGTVKQCAPKTCAANDRGEQYIKTCSRYVNEDGTLYLSMVVLFSEVYGPDCYCPCVGYFMDEVKGGL